MWIAVMRCHEFSHGLVLHRLLIPLYDSYLSLTVPQ